jgi:hypothetical protein
MRVTKMAAGFAVGYVLGTRAGRDTYERIVDGTRTLTNQPAAQRVLATGHDAATTMAKTADTGVAPGASVDPRTDGGHADVDRSTRSI